MKPFTFILAFFVLVGTAPGLRAQMPGFVGFSDLTNGAPQRFPGPMKLRDLDDAERAMIEALYRDEIKKAEVLYPGQTLRLSATPAENGKPGAQTGSWDKDAPRPLSRAVFIFFSGSPAFCDDVGCRLALVWTNLDGTYQEVFRVSSSGVLYRAPLRAFTDFSRTYATEFGIKDGCRVIQADWDSLSPVPVIAASEPREKCWSKVGSDTSAKVPLRLGK